MEIKEIFKKIKIKKDENIINEFIDNVNIKSPDGSVIIQKGNSCIITGTAIDDTVGFITGGNNITIEDEDTNNVTITSVASSQLTQVSTLFNNESELNNVSIRSRVYNANSINAVLEFYSISNHNSSIELSGNATFLSEIGHSVGVTTGIDDNSISFSVNDSARSGVIGEAEDGSYMDGAIGTVTPDILTPTTPIGHAIDWINEYLLALTPADNGISLDNSDLSLNGISFEEGYISDDSTASTINYNVPYIAGFLSSRILTKSQISNLFKVITIAFKNADNGILNIELNGTSLGNFNLGTAFQETDRNGSQDVNTGQYLTANAQELNFISVEVYQGLPYYQEAVIETIVSNADTLLQNGYNTLKAIHTIGMDVRETNEFQFYFNDTTDAPSVNAGSIVIAKGVNITTRQMSGVTLINGGNDDITSPTFNDISKYAYKSNIFSVTGDVFASTDITHNDTNLNGNSSPIDWQDIIGFTNKAINIKNDLKYYDIPTTTITAINLVNNQASSLLDTDTWIVDTYNPNNGSNTMENFNDETRRMYYGTPYLKSVTSISGNDIACTGADFTGMVGFYIENLTNNTFAKITAVSGTTATLDSQIFIAGDNIKVYVTGSLMLISDKNNFNSAATLVGRDYTYSASNDMTEALCLLGRITRPSINFSADHFPVGSPSYVPLDGKYATFITYFTTSGVRTGMKLVLEGLGSIVNFQNFIQEIRITIPFDDTVGVGTSGYNGTNFDPDNINKKPALYRGLLYKSGGSGQYDGSLGNPIEGSGIRLGEPTLNGSDIEIDFTTGTLNNLLASYYYFVEIIIKKNAPIFSLSNDLMTGMRLEER